MKEDRSWVAPLAFVTFGLITIVAIFAFLWQENLLLSERGTGLTAWLTLILTAFAFLAAVSAFFVAMKQMRDGQTQKNIAIVNEIKERLERIAETSEIINKLHYTGTIIDRHLLGKEVLKVEIREIKDIKIRIEVLFRKDYYKDLGETQRDKIIIANTANNFQFIITELEKLRTDKTLIKVFNHTLEKYKSIERDFISSIREKEKILREDLRKRSEFD